MLEEYLRDPKLGGKRLKNGEKDVDKIMNDIKSEFHNLVAWDVSQQHKPNGNFQRKSNIS